MKINIDALKKTLKQVTNSFSTQKIDSPEVLFDEQPLKLSTGEDSFMISTKKEIKEIEIDRTPTIQNINAELTFNKTTKEAELQAMQEKIDAATKAYTEAAEALQKQLESILKNLEEINEKLSAIEEELAQKDEQIKAKEELITQKEKQIDENNKAIADKDDELTAKNEEITKKTDEVNENKTKISDLANTIKNLDSEISTVEGQITSLSSDEDEAQKTELQSKLSSLKQQKAEKEQEKAELEENQPKLEKELTRLKQKKEIIEGEKAKIQLTVGQQTEDLEQLNKEKAELEAEKAPLEQQKQNLTAKKTSLEADKAATEKQIEENENSENKKLMDEGPSLLEEIEKKYETPDNPFEDLEGDSSDTGTTTDGVLDDAAAEKISYAINQVKDDVDQIVKKGGSKIHTEFGMDTNGNIVFQESKTKAVYDEIVKRVKSELNDFKVKGNVDLISALGGEKDLEKIIQASWINTYNDFNSSQSNNTEDFVNKVLDNINSAVNRIKDNPELKEVYTNGSSYADKTLTDGLAHYNKKDTYGNDEKISYKGTPIQYSDGSVHLDKTVDDNDYQDTMNELLERLKAKYPNVDEDYLTQIFRNAQQNAIATLQGNKNDCPYGTGNNSGRVEDGNAKDWSGKDNRKGDDSNIDMDQMVQMTLYNFDKELYKSVAKDGDKAVKTETSSNNKVSDTSNNQSTPSQNTTVKNAAEKAAYAVNEVKDDIDKIVKKGGSKIHTEFGMDTNGNIVFQESKTKAVYDEIYNRVKNELNDFKVKGNVDVLGNLGGEATLQKLVQAAWISTYNSFNSSQSNNTEQFVTKVLDNLKTMMTKIQNDSSLLESYTQRTSYADKTLTDGLTHYNKKDTHGNDERVSYKGTPTQYSDGSVHLDNTVDDKDYQDTMEQLLGRLIQKYSSSDKATVTKLFRAAQKAALASLQGNKNDCPYGTGNNSGRVEDGNSKNWSGKDNRKDDNYNIDMDQLVQMTLYQFDKLFYQSLMK